MCADILPQFSTIKTIFFVHSAIRKSFFSAELSGIVPYLLAENFSHWYNPNRDTVEFRPKSFSDAYFATADGIQYEVDLSTGHLKHRQSERLLLDVRSSSFQKIIQLVGRLNLSILQAIAENPNEFSKCPAPQYESYTNLANTISGLNCYEIDPIAIVFIGS